jgi:hypothetical protein
MQPASYRISRRSCLAGRGTPFGATLSASLGAIVFKTVSQAAESPELPY